MTVAPLSTPYGQTLFCDDIRFEVNGKVTLVGVYAGDMIFGSALPATLPKFCLRISYTERPNESTEPIQIRVYMPGEEKGRDEPSFKIDVARENVEQIPIVPLGDTDGEQLKTMVFHLSLEAVNVKQEGRIRVRAYRGDIEVRLGSVRVITKPSSATLSVPTVSPPPPAQSRPDASL